MADKPKPPPTPLELLQAENIELQRKIAALEAAAKTAAPAPKATPRKVRQLSPDAPDAFQRPYDGR